MAMRELTISELGNDLAAVLEAVERDGETVMLVRDGQRVATVAPAQPPPVTWTQFVEQYVTWPKPDPSFADDLEAIKREQPLAETPEWQ